MQPDDRNRYDLRRDILPIVVVKREGYPTPKGFKGTGFLIGKNAFVTCSHCDSDYRARPYRIRFSNRKDWV